MAAKGTARTTGAGERAPAAPVSPVSAAVLDGIAAHARAAGAALVLLLHADGAFAYADASAGGFFERYVLPALRHAVQGKPLREHVRQMTAQSRAQALEVVPGAVLCAVPFVDRRQVRGALLLAGKHEDFGLGEDVLRVCGLVAADAAWLGQQARSVPPMTPERLLAITGMVQSMLADRVRVNTLEQELNSLSTQLANAYEELTLIDQISGGMRVNRSSADFFRQACLDVMQVLSVRGMGVALRHDKMREDPVLYGEMSLPPGHVHRLAEQLLVTLRDRKSPILVNDLHHDKNFHWLSDLATQLIAVPMLRRDQVLGCLFALDKVGGGGGEFDSVDSKLLSSIANESAIYLENAMLFGDVHGLMMGLLHSLTSAVDAKDAYTCGHSERVALLSRCLASRMQLTDNEVERIYMAGLLHDVGKIGVPESVLQKTGRLTPDEFELMKKHPQIGARILNDVKQLEDIIPGVLHHHERYDGKGYPFGLTARDIPLMGRIICLADCFDAMTSNRTYRKALPVELALIEIRRCSGTQFDPVLAEVFLRIRADEFRALLRDHQQQAKKLLELQETLRAA
jgi:HD-GYP domain-containing protein (c-di-GMP phosphodiesterase class II)